MPAVAVQIEPDNQPAAPKPAGKVRFLTLADLDKRTTAAKRARNLIQKVHGDLGGIEHLAAGEQQVVQRAVLLGVMAEDIESRWLMGEAVDPTVLATIANAQRRLFETVGLKRVSRDITPTLEQIAKHLADAEAVVVDADEDESEE
jgi:hypothetical protein